MAEGVQFPNIVDTEPVLLASFQALFSEREINFYLIEATVSMVFCLRQPSLILTDTDD